MKQLIFLFLSVMLLAACAPSQSIPAQPTTQTFVTSTMPPTPLPMPTSNVMSMQVSDDMAITPTPTTDPSIFSQLFPGSNAGNEMTRIDQQGMVSVEVTPINLGMPGDTLIFEVFMNTHSVDLSMDLAQLATLTTDSGLVIPASMWDAPRGGHHVSGKLTFPAIKDGAPIFNEVTSFTLQIRNVDADLRTFEWDL